MAERVLITGGAGFIGSHVADALLADGYEVVALDSLEQQVHPGGRRPAYLDTAVELRRGDVRDPYTVRSALDHVDAVVHLAAKVGVGQSMYEPCEYVSANCDGTAVLLDALINDATLDVRKLVVASSMSVYGEGLYRNRENEVVEAERRLEQLELGLWDPLDERGLSLIARATPESKQVRPGSVYAQTKWMQEQLCLQIGAAYKLPTVALRFFNVYGPRQALSNPYTGALAIFGSRLLSRARPIVYEDGEQRRDFVHVHDIAYAVKLALEQDGADGQAVNVGTGQWTSVRDVAELLGELLGVDLEPEIAESYRAGDVRHCYADARLAMKTLGYTAEVSLRQGLGELVDWMRSQQADDRTAKAHAELVEHGLVIPAHADRQATP